MATIRPFRALRPVPDRVAAVAAPPYDVVDTAEARALAADNPDSFLRVSRPELELDPGTDPHTDEVYQLGRTRLEELVERGALVRDTDPGLLVYRLQMGSAVQTGVVGCVSVDEYRAGLIATHEHTRPDKETDRTRHIDVLGAHPEPVFLMYRREARGADDVADVLAHVVTDEPTYDLEADGVRHTLWQVADADLVAALVAAFGRIPKLYVADGHHRCAAASRVADVRLEESAQQFPAAIFPADDLTVMDYNRVVSDLGAYDAASLLAALESDFEVEPAASAPRPARHEFGLYTDGGWHLLRARSGVVDEGDPLGRLDVAVLTDRVLAPLLGIENLRTDQRIAFVGGVRGTEELERLVDSGRFAAAFAMHPTEPVEVMDVADLGEVMPPKSTWFEPKLRSGLFVHPID